MVDLTEPVSPDELRAFRDAHNLTQAELATLLGGNAPGRNKTIQKWEKGLGQPFCLRAALYHVADNLARDQEAYKSPEDSDMEEAAHHIETYARKAYEHPSVHWSWIRAAVTRAASRITE